jgi:bifunctional non-homologous end joining protein LigD
MLKRKLPARCVVPAQPVERDKPPVGAAWIHEIKHDGYRMIVRRDGGAVRLWTRNAVDFTNHLPAIASAASRLAANSFTIDGEAVVLGPDGLSQFDQLRRRAGGRVASLYAFDLIELDGHDARSLSLLARKELLAGLLRGSTTGILLNQHIAAEGAIVFAEACKLGAEGIVSKRVDAPYRSGPYPAWTKVRNPASIAVQRERSEKWNR